MKRWLVPLALALLSSAACAALPYPLWGVTVDDVSAIDDVTAAVQAMPTDTVVRLNFDPGSGPADYADAVSKLSPVSYIMGQPVDSSEVKSYSVSGYVARFQKYWNAFGEKLDAWEVGNEVNGEWLGSTSSVVQKIHGAYQLVKSHGGTTVLTLYYNEDCWSRPANEMFRWAQNNVPADMKAGLDYVLVSYYPYDCNGPVDASTWPAFFQKLHGIFPNSKLGFGELGVGGDGGTQQQKAQMLLAFYGGLGRFAPYYVGGYFWWYYAEDMVPYTQALWTDLYNDISMSPL